MRKLSLFFNYIAKNMIFNPSLENLVEHRVIEGLIEDVEVGGNDFSPCRVRVAWSDSTTAEWDRLASPTT